MMALMMPLEFYISQLDSIAKEQQKTPPNGFKSTEYKCYAFKIVI